MEELLEKSRDPVYVSKLTEKYIEFFGVTIVCPEDKTFDLAIEIQDIRKPITLEQAEELMVLALSEESGGSGGHMICDAVFECLTLTFGGTEISELLKYSAMVNKWYS